LCTVTWIPHAADGCYLTSNRDESPLRDASEIITKHTSKGLKLVYPKDPLAGGTWFCGAADGRALCLLNGGKVKHLHNPPYGRSRGLVLLDAFELSTFDHFIEVYAFDKIEPFTLVMVDPGGLKELIWDGQRPEVNLLNPEKPHIWASSSLYSSEVMHKREYLFKKFMSSPNPHSLSSILHFHQFGDTDHWNGFVINREERICTLSITSIRLLSEDTVLIHKNLITHQDDRITL
jgi:hypothetical protein